MIDFSLYMLPYSVVSTIFVLTTTSVAIQYLSWQAFANLYPGQGQDPYWYFLIAALRMYFSNRSGALMYRVAAIHSEGWTVLLLVQTIFTKYLIENLFLTVYISIYYRLVLLYATKQSGAVLAFEKSPTLKREMINRSIFRGAAQRRKELLRNKQKAEVEARNNILKEMKGLRIMRGSEGKRLFKNAMGSALRNSKRKIKSDPHISQQPSLSSFAPKKPEKTSNADDSKIHHRRKNRLISELTAFGSNEVLQNKLSLPLAQVQETGLMSDRKENILTLETARENKELEFMATTKVEEDSIADHSKPNFSPIRQFSHAEPNSARSRLTVQRSRTSHLSLLFPNKNRLLRKISMMKGIRRVSKPSALVLWFDTPQFLMVSTVFSMVLAIITTLSLKPVACIGWIGYYPILAIYCLCNLYFLFEVTLLVSLVHKSWIEVRYFMKQQTQVSDSNSKVVVKSLARFSWFDVVSIIGNVIHTIVYPTMCNSSSSLVYISQVIVCVNYAKLIRRIADFKKIFKIMLQVIIWFASNSIFFVILVFFLALITHSLFSKSILYCTSARISMIEGQDCAKYQGQKVPFSINYGSLWRAIVSIYAALNRVYWFYLLELSLIDHSTRVVLYEAVHFMVIISLSTYFYLAFRGMAISLNFITIERLSIHNIGDHMTRAGQQMIMTEELLIQRGLPVHLHINKTRLSEACRIVLNSRAWNFSYTLIMLAGFVFNWTQ